MKRATAKHLVVAQAVIISIHALVKRATCLVINILNVCDISIHALVKRATVVKPSDFKVAGYFNPRPREEGDQGTLSRASISSCISIHALVKRATANLYNDYLYFGTKYHISDIFPQ